MQGEIEDIQRKSEMDVIRQRKINQEFSGTEFSNATKILEMQQMVIDSLEEIKDKQVELKKELKKK